MLQIADDSEVEKKAILRSGTVEAIGACSAVYHESNLKEIFDFLFGKPLVDLEAVRNEIIKVPCVIHGFY